VYVDLALRVARLLLGVCVERSSRFPLANFAIASTILFIV
jgi:hypothetical protein